MSLCTSCQKIGLGVHVIELKPSYQALLDSALSCALCSLLVDNFKISISTQDSEKSTTSVSRRERVSVCVRYHYLKKEIFCLGLLFSDKNFVWQAPDSLTFCPNKHPLSKRAFWSDPQLSLYSRLPVALEWLKECDSSHKSCVPGAGIFPSRVIDVDLLETGTGPRLRTLLSDDLPAQPYAALSHCWGFPSYILRTTKDKLPQYSQSLPLVDLPKTFKDAIEITRKLNIPFLWIDSLCIVQDDQLDWENESLRMGDIYRNSYVTISATASENSSGGCCSHLIMPSKPIEFTPEIAFTDVGESRMITSFRGFVRPTSQVANAFGASSIEPKSLQLSPMRKRGWILQESVLSRRVIHFAEDQMYWQCYERFRSEDGTIGEAMYPRSKPRVLDYDARDPRYSSSTWWLWVEDYTSRMLSKREDKFFAFAGITSFYEEKTGDLHVLGLWKSDLPRGLLWMAEHPAQPSLLSWAPSWSWYSIDARIKRTPCTLFVETEERSKSTEVELISADVIWSGAAFTSTIMNSTITLTGRLKSMSVLATQSEFRKRNREAIFCNGVNNQRDLAIFDEYTRSPKRSSPAFGVFDFDPPALGTMVSCLLIVSTHLSGPNYHGFLILSQLGLDANRFHRIGVGVMESSAFERRRDFWDESISIVHLV